MRRISLALALAVSCLLVLAACGGSNSKSSAAGADPVAGSSIAGADVAPASATVFASITTDSTSAQWKQAMQLLAGIPSLQTSLDKSLSSSGITLADVEGALGPTTVFVELGTSAKPTEVILTNPKDSTKLKAILARDKTEKSVTTEIDSWLAIAPTQAALDQFNAATGSGKLSDSGDFKTATAGISADALVKAYFKGSAISASTLASLGSTTTTTTTSSATKALNSAISANQLEWGTVTVSAVAKGLSIDGVFKGKKSVTNSSSTLTDQLPSGTSFAVVLNGKSLGLDKAVQSLSKNPKYSSQIPQMEAALGVKLADLATLAGSEMSIYGTESGVGLLIKAPDPAKTKTMLDKVVALLAAQLNGSSKSVTVGGVQATELTFGTMKIDYGVKDGDLFIVTDVSALPGSSKLSSDPAYSAAATELPIPASNLGVAFVDFAKLAALSKSGSPLVGSLDGSGSATTNLNQLEGLSSMLGYASANGDKVEVKAFLSTK
ncbi:MAG: hypothetical protein WBQ14_07955, partial [Gaiellaceae bacterium]